MERAKVVRVDLSRPLEPIAVEAGYGAVFLIAAWGDTVVAEAFVAAASVIAPDDQLRALSPTQRADVTRQSVFAAVTEALVPPAPAPPRPAVAVVVCTRDRPEDLRRCLRAVLALNTSPAEVIVVDNGPGGDATAAVCRDLGVRHVHEPLPGQTRARNRGIAACSAELVAFTDDDCVPDAGWLDDLAVPFADPLVMAVTGYVGPLELETAAQCLFERHGGFRGHPRRMRLQWDSWSPVEAGASAGNGANMIVRRDAFASVGPFAEALGPGTPARSSDDKELFYRLLAAGFRIVHDPSRVVWHRHRRDEPELRRIMRDYGVSEFACATHLLVVRREIDALRMVAWWLRHYATDVAERAVPLWITAEEVRGALSGPLALVRSLRSRRGIAPVPAPAPAGDRPSSAVAVAAETPQVTVTIASRDRRESLRRTLRSLAGQGDGFEVVAVLDGSTDGSAQMARDLDVPYALRVVEQDPLGLAVARNRGAREARMPVVVFLDDDIEVLPGFVAAHAARHAEGGARVVVGPFPPATRPRRLWEHQVHAWWHDHFRRKAAPGHRMTYVDFVDGNSSMPVALLERLGGYDEGFPGGRRQDWELGMRILKAGIPLVFEPRAAGRHHLTGPGPGTLRNMRREGHNDVLLAMRHPEALAHLHLADAWKALCDPRAPLHVMRRVLAAPGGRAAVIAALEAFEAARMRRAWRRVSALALRAEYATGVCEALPGERERAAFFAPLATREHVTMLELDLDRPAALELPVAGGATEVTLRRDGRVLATVPGTLPGRQWDPEDLADRLAEAAA